MLRRNAIRFIGNTFGSVLVPPVCNEPLKNYAPGAPETIKLQEAVNRVVKTTYDIPCIVDGKEYRPGKALKREDPSDNKRTAYTYYNADKELIAKAIESGKQAAKAWSVAPFQDRAAVMLKAAHLMTNKYRADFNAYTMVGQGKNAWQGEIDAIAEAADFLRFNTKFAEELYAVQPQSPASATLWNMTEYRPLEGFMLAVSPFNFISIGVNLATAPALMGNTTLWKPSSTSLLSAYNFMKILEEAGLPKGVINFIPSSRDVLNDTLTHQDLSGIVFTGSTAVFNKMWATVGTNIDKYKMYPRCCGETGGKNFHLIHPTAELTHAVACTMRAAFEYQGQKCSACSRLYCPKSMWPAFKAKMVEAAGKMKVGGPADFKNFMCGVIDGTAYKKICGYIDIAKKDSANYKIVCGGTYSDAKGWFIQPTIIESLNPATKLMKEEIFGPVLTCYVYDDSQPGYWQKVLPLVDGATLYGLTGSIFCRDRAECREAAMRLRHAAGNLYINDKSTGAVVGQQPFGGGRVSGTNDKPGSAMFLNRFVTPRTIKETFDYYPAISYPHQLPENITVS